MTVTIDPKRLARIKTKLEALTVSSGGCWHKPVGAAHWRAKLSEAAVRNIRARYSAGEKQEAIAADFNINAATVSRVARRIWRTEVA